MNSRIRQVYETLKTDSRKGDFVYLIKQDIKDLEIDITEEDIQMYTKKFIHEKVKHFALSSLTEENNQKTKTKHIQFDRFMMREYLKKNQNTF